MVEELAKIKQIKRRIDIEEIDQNRKEVDETIKKKK